MRNQHQPTQMETDHSEGGVSTVERQCFPFIIQNEWLFHYHLFNTLA